MTVHRRTFEARSHPRGSAERARLNESPITSEYMTSHRYASIGPHWACSFSTRSEAEKFDERG